MISLRDRVKTLVVEALLRNGGNQQHAADELEISRGTLRNILAEYIADNDSNGVKLSAAAIQKYLSTRG